MQLSANIRSSSRVPFLQALKTSIAVILAWFVAQLLLPTELPIFAAIAALLVVQPSINQSLGRAVERSLGVVGGVLVAFAVGAVFGTSSWVVLVAIVLCILLAWALRLSPGSSNQIPISAMLVLSIGLATPEYAFERVIETVIGASIALLVNVLIVPPVVLQPVRDSVSLLAEEVADSLNRVANALRSPQSMAELEELMIKARLLRPMLEASDSAIAQAEESLTLNPRQAKYRRVLEPHKHLQQRLRALVTRAIGMTRALRDHYDDSLYLEPSVQAFSLELSRAAHDLTLLARESTDAAENGRRDAEQPALTAPLIIATPHPQHWILIGSLMEDLRRVREEIVGD
ncbi:MAG TPA: FUSC family protein [Glaciibacter sp.]|nr:FUSC family protein [Glaciibacter sp.]